MPPLSAASGVLRSVLGLLSLRACTVVVVRHISSSSGLQALECCPSRPSSSTSPASLSSVNCDPQSVSFFEILRVRFFPIVSIGLRVIERDPLPLEERSEGMKLNQDCSMCSIKGRRVGRQPDMMPMEGSTEDQMKTSLLAQLMSLDLTSRVMVMIRYIEAKHTLTLSVSAADLPSCRYRLHIRADRGIKGHVQASKQEDEQDCNLLGSCKSQPHDVRYWNGQDADVTEKINNTNA